jgi:hypothetical protein
MSSRARSTSFIAPEDDGPMLGGLVEVAKLSNDSVPMDLFVMVLDALHFAHGELEQLAETEIPWTDEELERFKLAHDLQEGLHRAPEEWKPKLREAYQEAVADSVFIAPSGPTPSLMPGTLRSFDELWELLRRAALTQPAVADALHQSEVHL